ncbi:GL20761 [Drosophila persimilis]|uniref:GL20761 n=1 Tax=Drosophila persimilis TaxID=7234 RepID=B4H3Z7_DROPE|nr:GL20761 [Drosophila persimilis]
MGTKSPGGPQRCRLILQRCLAIQLTKPGHTAPEDFWMYDSGYMIFQVSFSEGNDARWELVFFFFFFAKTRGGTGSRLGPQKSA